MTFYAGGVILAVDTSLGSSVAIVDGAGAEIARAASADPLAHAEIIGDLLVRVLGAAGSDPITHVVAGMGPGPFTGLRIGIATARSFALGRGLPLIAVPSHLAAALTAIEADAVADGPFAVLTDARRRETAVTVFRGRDGDGIPRIAAETQLVPRDLLAEHLGELPAVEAAEIDAVALARIGRAAVAAGRSLAPAEPIYLRQPDVTLPGAPKKVGV